MEKLKITSKRKYLRNRVVSGHSPHRLLKMAQEQALIKPKNEAKE
ncbi:MAG: hypothetical protein ACW98U_17055 [Candidatus Thorarchaeota archaeon]|jgi:hypothetical protein